MREGREKGERERERTRKTERESLCVKVGRRACATYAYPYSERETEEREEGVREGREKTESERASMAANSDGGACRVILRRREICGAWTGSG